MDVGPIAACLFAFHSFLVLKWCPFAYIRLSM